MCQGYFDTTNDLIACWWMIHRLPIKCFPSVLMTLGTCKTTNSAQVLMPNWNNQDAKWYTVQAVLWYQRWSDAGSLSSMNGTSPKTVPSAPTCIVCRRSFCGALIMLACRTRGRLKDAPADLDLWTGFPSVSSAPPRDNLCHCTKQQSRWSTNKSAKKLRI